MARKEVSATSGARLTCASSQALICADDVARHDFAKYGYRKVAGGR
jgi:hypothetical protein